MSAKVIPFPRRAVSNAAPYPSVSDGLSVFSDDDGKTWRIAKQVGGKWREVTVTEADMETIAMGWMVVKEGLGR